MRPIVMTMVVILAFGPASLLADQDSETRINRDKLYHGDPDDFTKAGCIAADKVYLLIPAYAEIVDKGLTQDDPEYWILMNKANEVFKRALSKTEDDHEYDLIGELGSIVINGKKAPDITAKVKKIVRELVKNKDQE